MSLWRVPELVPDHALEQSAAKAAQLAFQHVPIIQPEQLAHANNRARAPASRLTALFGHGP